MAAVTFLGVAISTLPLPAIAQKAGNVSGIWLRQGGEAKFPMSQWSSKPLPLTPEGLKRFSANKPGKGPRQIMPALGNDPLGDANPPGLLRTLVYNRPFELIQLEDKILQTFEWGKTWRVIWTDGRPVPAAVDAGPYWYGYSVGKWSGDTLVAETVGLDGRAWMDEWGTPFTDNTRVEERWRRVDAETIELTITVHDPEIFTEPLVSDKKVYKLQKKGTPNGELLEVIFAPIDEKEFNERVRDPAASGPKKQ